MPAACGGGVIESHPVPGSRSDRSPRLRRHPGAFQIIAGLVAIIDDEYHVVTPDYTFDLDVTGWGWIHLIIGVIVFLAGVALFSWAAWAGYVAIAIAVLSAVADFFFIPYHPFWALVIIAIDVVVIRGLTRPGVLVR